MKTLLDRMIQRGGPLTSELALEADASGLGHLPRTLAHDDESTLVCGFCSTGCNLRVLRKDGAAVGLVPDRNHPVNVGMACPKGWEALAPLSGPGRARQPRVRRGSHLVESTWEVALQEMHERFEAIQAKHGKASVAWLGTGQLPTEELAFLGALCKFGMGMLHGDGNTRQCMATAATAYKQCFGFDAPPYTYADLEFSDVMVFVGANPCIAHPILWSRALRNPNHPAIVVLDPRRTETAVAATHHFALKPKSDLVLLCAVANILIDRGWIDHEYIESHTSGFEVFAEKVSRFTLDLATEATGLPKESIEQLATLIHQGKRVSFWWTMGVNQSHQGVRTAQAIIALALMTGNMGRPGTGANSITGQCNAMGSRLYSNTTNLLGGRDFANPTHRGEVATMLGMEVERIPTQPSLAYDQILEQILSGKIRGLWVVATNPAHSWINQEHLRHVFSRLDCLVVQDMYEDTETALLADILLPAAGWGEKEGTFINSERRIGTIRRVSRAPGQALADFHIFQLVAETWGLAELFADWTSPEAVFQILQRLSAERPCDMTGIDGYRELDRAGGIQWPCPRNSSHESSERRLFEDGRYFTADEKAQFIFGEPRPLPEPTTPAYPLTLLTGRGTSAQWHTQTRTKRSQILKGLSPAELYVEISPKDARALGIEPDDPVNVTSQRSSVAARAFVTNVVKPGVVFMAMHYETVNRLTFAAFDPDSRQPAYKACAVKVTKRNEIG